MQCHRDEVYLNMNILRFRGLIAALLAIASTVTPLPLLLALSFQAAYAAPIIMSPAIWQAERR
jgi:hypothetical protein